MSESIIKKPQPEPLATEIVATYKDYGLPLNQLRANNYEVLMGVYSALMTRLEELEINPMTVIFAGYDATSDKGPDEEHGDTYFFGDHSAIVPDNNPDEDVSGMSDNPLTYAIRGGTLGVYNMREMAGLCEAGVMFPDMDSSDIDGAGHYAFHTPGGAATLSPALVAEFTLK